MNRSLILIVLLGLFFSTAGVAQNKKAQKLVHKSFAKYTKAIITEDGEEAVKYLDKNTILYYKDLLDLTIHADSVTLRNLDFLQRLAILSLRHNAPSELIVEMDAKALIVYSVNNGLLSKNSAKVTSLGSVYVKGDQAKAKMVVDGQELPFHVIFNKETDGAWRMDITSIFAAANWSFSKLLEGAEMDEDEIVETALKMMTGTKPAATIWQPIVERED